MVYLDTNVLVYLLERHASYSNRVADALDDLRSQKQSFLTSVITITEFLAGTKSPSDKALHRVAHLGFEAVDENSAVQAAMLQRKHKLQIGDAIHLATAIDQQASLFFTNDKPLADVAKAYLPVKTL